MDGEDGRIYRRGRTLKTGKVWFNDNRSVMNCQVRDMSDTGAKVRFEIAFDCPKRIALYLPIDEKHGHIRPCETKWVRGTEVGFRYLGEAQMVMIDDIPKYKMDEDWMTPTWTPIE